MRNEKEKLVYFVNFHVPDDHPQAHGGAMGDGSFTSYSAMAGRVGRVAYFRTASEAKAFALDRLYYSPSEVKEIKVPRRLAQRWGVPQAHGGAMTTVDLAMSVDESEIDSLMAAAGQAGDRAQVAICLVALGRDGDDCDDWERECIEENREALERKGIIPEHVDADVRAQAECARVIGRGHS